MMSMASAPAMMPGTIQTTSPKAALQKAHAAIAHAALESGRLSPGCGKMRGIGQAA